MSNLLAALQEHNNDIDQIVQGLDHILAVESLLVKLVQENKIPRPDFVEACLHIDACKQNLRSVTRKG